MIYPITPVPAPRMTRRDRWAKRPCVLRYWAFRDEVRLRNVTLPERHVLTFVLPMPKSWSAAKRAAMDGQWHRLKPDLDNLAKGLLDAMHKEDKHIASLNCGKKWGQRGEIHVEVLP